MWFAAMLADGITIGFNCLRGVCAATPRREFLSNKPKITRLILFYHAQFIKRCAAMLISSIIINQIPFSFYRIMMYVIYFLHKKIFIINAFGIE